MRLDRICLLAVAGLVLSACAGVPTSGRIEQGGAVAPAGDDQLIRVIANPPRDGMTPEEIVRGFQEATAGADDKYLTAREYLTTSASRTWDPTAGILVYDSNGVTLTGSAVSVAATGNLAATIGSTGEYDVAGPGTKLSTAYGMEKVDGQWRISAPPNGLVLGAADIERGYRSYDLYYFTRDFEVLVPAPITVPRTGSGLATLLVRSLVRGATPWIAPAVRTAFPEGTKLALDSVPITDGVADVNLTSEALAADDATRQKLSAQLVWTLRQVPEVTSVQISVNGQPLSVPGVGSPQPVSSWPLVDPDAWSSLANGHAVDKRGLLTIDKSATVTVAAKIKPALSAPGVSLDSGRVAGLSADRRSLLEARVVEGATAVRRYTGAELSRPSFDRTGAIWVVDRGRGLVMIKDGKSSPMPIAELPAGVTDRGLLAAAVSRDGTRMGLLVQRGTRIEPMVARIDRVGESIRVSTPRRIESIMTDAVDLAWADADTLAVLGSTGASSLEVISLEVGTSRVRRLGAAPGSTTLAAAPGEPVLVGAGTSIFRNSGSTWTRVADAQFPVYPG